MTGVQTCALPISYTEIQGGTHNIWTMAAGTEGLVEWMFTQQREDAGMSDRNDLDVDEFVVGNPMTDNLLEIKTSDNAEMTLFSLAGQKIITQQLSSGNNLLHLNIPVGFYLMKMKMNNQIHSKIILKCD